MGSPQYEPSLRICSYDHGGYVAWGWWKSWDGVGGLKEFIRRSIARLDRFPNLKWGFHIEGATWEWALANDPKFVAEFKRWVDEVYPGRISLASGGYGQPLSCTIGEESNVRHLVYDYEVYRRLGYRVNIYMQNEHGFFPQLPQLLRGVGIDKAILRTVWGMYGICPEIDASKVRWRAPDGSWVEAIPTYVGVNRGLGKNAWDTRIIIGLEGFIDLEPFRRYCLERGIKYPVAVRIDDYPLPYDHDGSGGFDRFCSFSEMPGYRWVTGEEAFAEIPLENATLDTTIDDYPIQMPWGYMGNLFWNLNRRAECALLTAERLAAVNAILGGANWEETLEKAWKVLLTAQHHDINICGVSSGGEHGDFLFEVAQKFYSRVIDQAETVTKASLKSILTMMTAEEKTDRIILAYNPLNWPRETLVEVRVLSDKKSLPKSFRVSQDGVPLEYQVVKTEEYPGGYLSLTTLAIPLRLGPQGFAAVNLEFSSEDPAAPDPEGLIEKEEAITVRTRWGRFHLERKTGECLAYDLEDRPWLLPGAKNGVFTATVNGVECRSQSEQTEVVARGPLFTVVRVLGRIGELPYRTEVTIYRDYPRLDFRTTVEVHGQTVGTTEVPAEWEGKDEPVVQERKLLVHFTPALKGPAEVVQDFPFTVAPTRNSYINAGYWVDVSDGQRGMTLANRGTMGYLWDGRTLSNILLYSGKYSWGERQAFLDGSYTLEYSLSFHEGDWREGRAHRLGLEYNFPPVALANKPRPGKMRPSELEVRVVEAATGAPCANLAVSAFYPREGRVYLRLYEYLGVPETAVRVFIGGRPVGLVPVDLLHREIGGEDSRAVIPAFGIKTFRLEIGPENGL